MRSALASLAALLVLGAIVRFYAPARLALWVALYRSSKCPASEALRSEENRVRLQALTEEIARASRLRETDPDGYQHYDTPDGPYWIPPGNDGVLPFHLAEQARNIYGWGGHGLRVGDVVLDCGANVGVYTRKALKAGARLVVAIEPAPENILCLRRTFAREIASGSVIVYPKGVWDKDDLLTLHVDPVNSSLDSFLTKPPGGHVVERVALTTIDGLVKELRLDSVDYIKMDIEGAEVKALRGARETITKFVPRMALSTYHAADHPVTIPKLVKSMFGGYHSECGPCLEAGYGIRPEVVYFFH